MMDKSRITLCMALLALFLASFCFFLAARSSRAWSRRRARSSAAETPSHNTNPPPPVQTPLPLANPVSQVGGPFPLLTLLHKYETLEICKTILEELEYEIDISR